MTKTEPRGRRKAPRTTTWWSTIAEIQVRHDREFARLDPRVQAIKASKTAQVAAGAGIAALLLSGRPLTALAVGAAWVGSRPLTHLVAASVACVGVAKDAAKQALQQFRTPAAATPERSRPSKARRRRTKAQVAISPAPIA